MPIINSHHCRRIPFIVYYDSEQSLFLFNYLAKLHSNTQINMFQGLNNKKFKFILFLWLSLSCFSFYRYVRPQFFYNNPLFSFIQYVIGPYADELGNVLPQAVEGVGVPVDPLAFAGLLGRLPLWVQKSKDLLSGIHSCENWIKNTTIITFVKFKGTDLAHYVKTMYVDNLMQCLFVLWNEVVYRTS